jgi:hypothetical protein
LHFNQILFKVYSHFTNYFISCCSSFIDQFSSHRSKSGVKVTSWFTIFSLGSWWSIVYNSFLWLVD